MHVHYNNCAGCLEGFQWLPFACPRAVYDVMIKCWLVYFLSIIGILIQRQGPRTFYEVHGLLNFPEFKVLKWSAADVEKYSEAARTIGAPLSEGEELFTKLQSTYK